MSYRREDSGSDAGRIADRLRRDFGDESVFMDVDGIALGVDFVKRLTEEVARCDVLLAVIGRSWIDFPDETGARRLDNPQDFVRIELRAALQRDIRVIPILTSGAKVPRSDMLPADIAPLAVRNGLELRHTSFHADLDRLVGELKSAEPDRREPRSPPGITTPVERGPQSGWVTVSLNTGLWLLGSILGLLVTVLFLAVAELIFDDRKATNIVLGITAVLSFATVVLWTRREKRRRLPLLVGILAMAWSCSLSTSLSGGPNQRFIGNLLWLHPGLTALLIVVFTFTRRWWLERHRA